MRAHDREEAHRGGRITAHARPRLPNFLVIGAMKAGTTSLYHYLRDHPQVFMPETKELNFFNPRRNWRRGVPWYERQFGEATHDVIAIGEASTSYTKFPWVEGVPDRIESVLQEVRFIYLVRDPIERMQSHYLHNVITGQERRPIEEAFQRNPLYLNVSRYGLQIEQYVPRFSRDRFMVLDSRDLRHDRVATLGRVFAFLGVDDAWISPEIEREYLRSTDRRRKPRIVRGLRRIPQLHTIGMFIPGSIKSVKRKVVRQLPTDELDRSKARLSDDLRLQLRQALREDVERLRPFMRSGFDGWGIA